MVSKEREELIRLIAKKNIYLDKKQISPKVISIDLSKKDLSSLNLSGVDLTYADFTNSTLTNTNFTKANVSNADFSNANLSGANLSGANLSNANFFSANLSYADLSKTEIYGANLSFATLVHADLSDSKIKKSELPHATLSHSNFSDAELEECNFYMADLDGVNFSGANIISSCFIFANFRNANFSKSLFTLSDLSLANLSYANFIGATLLTTNLTGSFLPGANFDKAKIGGTVWGSIDFRQIEGIKTIKHIGASTIGVDSIIKSQGNVPEIFLRGIGLPDKFISYVNSLVNQPFDFYSCFICYSRKDQNFAERLYSDLQHKGVRCWFDEENLKTGDNILYRIDESIHIQDKLLVVLSKNSINSGWVSHEVQTALVREIKEKRTILFPVRIDTSIMKINSGWAIQIKDNRYIVDFSKWKDHDLYQKAFGNLLQDLKVE